MRALPAVEPHVERGHTFRSEYRWQETQCPTRGRWHQLRPGCRCSDYHRLAHRMGRYGDHQVTIREALRIVRRYLPDIRTEAELFRAAFAWTPVKVILAPRPRWSLYTNALLVAWAKAKAAGKPAPWEAAQKRRAA